MKIFLCSTLILLFLLALPLLGGCAKSQKTTEEEAPSVSLADMELEGIKGLETIFRLQLRVINPDEEPLEISSVRCTLKVQGKSFAKGFNISQVTVPASGTATVPVRVYAGMADLLGSVIDLLQHNASPAKSLKYELTGSLRLSDKSSIPFKLSGALPPKA
ncbi:Late embryogenesis abundant protein [Candidatus Electronema halotolerans]|jgi:LEA14-like dessication related protein